MEALVGFPREEALDFLEPEVSPGLEDSLELEELEDGQELEDIPHRVVKEVTLPKEVREVTLHRGVKGDTHHKEVKEVTLGLALLQEVQEVILLAPEVIPAPSLL